MTAGYVVGIWMAVKGYSYWALVGRPAGIDLYRHGDNLRSLSLASRDAKERLWRTFNAQIRGNFHWLFDH